MDNHCVICYQIIPEGRMVCPDCERAVMRNAGRNREGFHCNTYSVDTEGRVGNDHIESIDRKVSVCIGKRLGLYLGRIRAALDKRKAGKRHG